jgi:putative ABC transport system permease protein
VQGREPAADDEAVVDAVFASRNGLHVGSGLDLLGQGVRVVGLSGGTWGFMAGYIFVTRSALASRLRLGDGASFVLVTPGPDTDQSTLVTRLSSLPGLHALSKSDVAANDRQIWLPPFQMIIRLMALIASVVGALVVGLVVYTATLERRREYAVLKAVGGRNPVLYRTVLLQALIAALAGAFLGGLLAGAAGWLITTIRPDFLVVLRPGDLLLALGAGLVIAAAGALIPARALAGVAPAEAMRS